MSAVAMTILLKATALLPALLLGRIIDQLNVAEGIDVPAIQLLLTVLCAAVVMQSVVTPLQTYQLVSLVQTTLKDLSIHWTEVILGKEFEQFSSLRIGALIKSVERGITAHEKFLTFFITSGFPLVIEVVLIASVFAPLGGMNIFLTLLGVSISYMLVYRGLVKWRRPYLVAVNDQEDSLSSALFETLHAGKVIKLEQACSSAIEPLGERYSAYALAATKVASTGAILGAVRTLYLGLCSAGLLAWGVLDQTSGSPQMTVGDLVAVVSMAGMFLGNFSALAEAYRTLDQFLIDKHRLEEILRLKNFLVHPQQPFSKPLSVLSLSIVPTITDRQLDLRAGQSVAIIGASGAGKTTIMETLSGTLATPRHLITLNGEPLHPAALQAYLNHVRYCPQAPIFLEGAFGQSVLFGQTISPHLTTVVQALDLQGLVANREIAEGAKNLSGGEAKRLSLLRIFNRPGDFNLLDEPTASLDQETALRVWDTIFMHFQNTALVCVTHDTAALDRFDRIIVIREGAVVADGPWLNVKNDKQVAQTLEQMSKLKASPDRGF
jgi:ATP-binding cassette subfamily B protein/ATP-binding cassette subfamily B protein RtxE